MKYSAIKAMATIVINKDILSVQPRITFKISEERVNGKCFLFDSV